MQVQIIEASMEHFSHLRAMDKEVIGDYSRSDRIKHAILEGRCRIYKTQSCIAGFLIFTTDFFDCCFISLVIVKAAERRNGVATALLADFLERAPTAKIFSSTNRSNTKMQNVFKATGFKRSGYIENLDDGDPEIIYFTLK